MYTCVHTYSYTNTQRQLKLNTGPLCGPNLAWYNLPKVNLLTNLVYQFNIDLTITLL